MHFKDNIAAEESNAESDKKEICMENEMADKLDVLVEILFSYFHDITHLNGEIQTFESACFWFYKLWHDIQYDKFLWHHCYHNNKNIKLYI